MAENGFFHAIHFIIYGVRKKKRQQLHINDIPESRETFKTNFERRSSSMGHRGVFRPCSQRHKHTSNDPVADRPLDFDAVDADRRRTCDLMQLCIVIDLVACGDHINGANACRTIHKHPVNVTYSCIHCITYYYFYLCSAHTIQHLSIVRIIIIISRNLLIYDSKVRRRSSRLRTVTKY